jgi:hypothetical protein
MVVLMPAVGSRLAVQFTQAVCCSQLGDGIVDTLVSGGATSGVNARARFASMPLVEWLRHNRFNPIGQR